jgi:hypothetical protein
MYKKHALPMQQFDWPDGAALQLWQSLSVEQDDGHPLLFPDELPEELPPLLLPLLLLLLLTLLPLSSPAVASAAPPEELVAAGAKPVGVVELEPPHAINTARADRQRGVMIRFATLMLDSLCPGDGDTSSTPCEPYAIPVGRPNKGRIPWERHRVRKVRKHMRLSRHKVAHVGSLLRTSCP